MCLRCKLMKKVGRNDSCPCGSGRKYKGLSAERRITSESCADRGGRRSGSWRWGRRRASRRHGRE
ncbi:MAG: SEC-C metal-binding domain-containing protein [Blastocatellia bacterium]